MKALPRFIFVFWNLNYPCLKLLYYNQKRNREVQQCQMLPCTIRWPYWRIQCSGGIHLQSRVGKLSSWAYPFTYQNGLCMGFSPPLTTINGIVEVLSKLWKKLHYILAPVQSPFTIGYISMEPQVSGSCSFFRLSGMIWVNFTGQEQDMKCTPELGQSR